MRRPLMYITSSFALGIILGHYLKPVIWLAIYFLLTVGASFKKEKMLLVFVIISLLGSLHLGFAFKKLELPPDLDKQTVTVRGWIVGLEAKDSNTVLTLRDKKRVCYLIHVKGKLGEEYIGDMVSLRGKYQLPDKRRNPGLFDYSLHLKSKGISAGISAFETNVTRENRVSFLISIPAQVRKKVMEVQGSFMSEESAALLVGILFGDKSAISEDVYEAFQKNGTAHILAVSGIHVGIIYAYISGFFRNRRSRIVTITVVLFLLFYCALAEFSPSVVRAVSMIVIHLIAGHLHRRYDFPSAIAFSALLMLLYNPYNLFNIGFQLSYMAVLSLAFVLPHFKEKKNAIIGPLISLISVQVTLAPLMAFHFMYFSFSAFVINIPIIFLAGIAVPLGVSLALMSFLPFCPITEFFLGSGFMALEKVLNLMTWLNLTASKTGLSHMNVRAPSLFFLFLFYGFFFFLISESFMVLVQQRKKHVIKAMCLVILICSIMAPPVVGDGIGKADMVFVDVGQGDCLHIRTPAGKNILIDGGGQRDFNVGKRILKPYLLKNGVKEIDLALVTHLHHDHYDGIATLCREIPVHRLGTYEGNALKLEGLKGDTGLKDENFLFLAAGDVVKVDKDTEIHVIYPQRRTIKEYEELLAEEDENLNSLVFLVKYKNVKVVVTGDLSAPGETRLMAMEENLKADILKIGHHGSRFSTGDAFLEAINPIMGVIQVGNNNYGHPHPDIIEKLEKMSIIIYRNDLHGAVLIKIKKEGLKVRTML